MPVKKEACTRCKRKVPPHEMTVASDGKGGSHGTFCARCWSEFLSERRGEEIEAVEIEPIRVKDANGRSHKFHFLYRPIPRGIEAFELKKGEPSGYKFAVMARDEESHAALMGRLLTKIRRRLAKPCLTPCELAYGGVTISGTTVRGRFELDQLRTRDPSLPCVYVDGRRFSWLKFGAMLGSFEGWDFVLKVVDASDED